MSTPLTQRLWRSKRPTRTTMPSIDISLLTVVCMLAAFGLLMVYSASIALADGPQYRGYGHYYFVLRHALFLALGALLAGAVSFIPMRVWEKMAYPVFVIAVLLLLLVLIPGIGREVNGARRWIPLGLVNFQPSEFMKVAMMIFAAKYVVVRKDHMSEFLRGFVPMIAVVGLVGGLLILEPDLGAFVVIACIAMGILFIGGIALRWMLGMITLFGGIGAAMIWFAPWRRERLFVYLDPWKPENAYGSAYQLSHSLIAFGRGEWFGVGLGSSIEKLHYLPEAHTDFIVAVIGEELGFVGVTLLILTFAFIIWRAFEIGRQAIAMERLFNGMLAQGVGVWFGVQTFINIGVCLGLLPTKGLTLPLVSYGGSAILMNLMAIALLLRVDHENRNLMRGIRR
ncbi:putative lipid II flippase FtsW [Paenalcaligenes hermetiae]|uniref:Probable peptidoglycan glycosyltransferase FtsW n=1 Tax=Paenalcaligenes hermetiae TaxID=1157987 RepID=A0ABP9M4B8_9BURK